MATTARSARGTFTTALPRDHRTIVEIIKLVAELAAAFFDKEPVEITQAEWNECRGQLEGYGEIPKIHGLLAQLPDRHGKPYGYRKLLRDLFDPERSFEHVARERVGVEDWPDLDRGHVDFALNRAADFERVTTFTPSHFDVIRDKVIAADRRRRARRGEDASLGLARRFPTSEQILRFYDGDWNRALVEHGLDPQPVEARRERAVRVTEAIVRFYRTTGFLPTKKQLAKFARYFQFSLEDWKGVWAEALNAGRAAIAEAGLAESPPYRPRHDRPVWEDEHGSRPWNPADARYRRKHYWTTEASVLAKVGDFLTEEVGTGRPASQDRYQDWSARADDRPSLEVVQRFGGLKALVTKASKANALTRARAEAKREAEPTAEEVAAREEAKLQEIVSKSQAQEILRILKERGEVGAREIEAAMGWGLGASSNWLPHLRRAGLIVCTTPSPVAKNARYRLPGEITAAQASDAARRREDELLRHPNAIAVRRFLEEQGEITSAQAAEALPGITQSTARVWLARFVERGFATREFQSIRGQHGGRRVVYRATGVIGENSGARSGHTQRLSRDDTIRSRRRGPA